jgi:hypothetical protein
VTVAAVKQEADALVPASRVSLEGILVLSSSQRIREGIGKVQAAQIAGDKATRGFGVREEFMKGSGLLPVLIDFATEIGRAAKENAAREAKRTAAPAPAAKQAVESEDEDTRQRGLVVRMEKKLKDAAIHQPTRSPGQ